MPSVSFYARKDGAGTPEMISVYVGRSTWIRAGNLVTPTAVSTRTAAGGPPVVRPVYTGDQDSLATNGIAGLALYDIRTDSNGKVISAPANGGVVTTKGNDVIYPTPTVESSQFDESTGYVKMVIARWCPNNLFKIKVQSDDVMSQVSMNVAYGLYVDDALTVVIADPTAPGYSLDVDEVTDKVCIVRDWTPRDATSIATAGAVWAIVEPIAATDASLLCAPQDD